MSLSVPDRLHVALRAALKARDTAAVSALRSALAAVGNAEAQPAPVAPAHGVSRYLAGSVPGLGATEASRRILTEAEISGIVSTEIAEPQPRGMSEPVTPTGQADSAARPTHSPP